MNTAQRNVGSDEPAATLPKAVTDRAYASFRENGYAVLRDVVPKQGLETFRDTLVDTFERERAQGRMFSGGGLMSGHLNCFPGEASRFVYDALVRQGVVSLLRSLSSGPLLGPNIGCNMNFPGSVAQHYHVDSNFKDAFMIANVAVVDTDLVNGAIDVVPKTHAQFHRYWRFVVEGRRHQALRLPLNQGDVLIRSSNLWHRGMPNHSAKMRPMLAFTWEKGGRQDDGFRWNDGAISFHPNWFRPNALGRLRERTFVTAPITYSAYRFVRSLVGKKGYSTI